MTPTVPPPKNQQTPTTPHDFPDYKPSSDFPDGVRSRFDHRRSLGEISIKELPSYQSYNNGSHHACAVFAFLVGSLFGGMDLDEDHFKQMIDCYLVKVYRYLLDKNKLPMVIRHWSNSLKAHLPPISAPNILDDRLYGNLLGGQGLDAFVDRMASTTEDSAFVLYYREHQIVILVKPPSQDMVSPMDFELFDSLKAGIDNNNPFCDISFRCRVETPEDKDEDSKFTLNTSTCTRN